MSTEVLTAEERACIRNTAGANGLAAKLLRLYDAALARVEAAGRDLVDTKREALVAIGAIGDETASHWLTTNALQSAESRLAEATRRYDLLVGIHNAVLACQVRDCARLAEATALLEEADNALTAYPEPRTEALRDRMQAFLSATPAPTAPVRVHTWCPKCDLKHVDGLDEKTGIDWATRPHKTHQCLGCGEQWRPHDYATVGVAAPAAPDEPNTPEERHAEADAAFAAQAAEPSRGVLRILFDGPPGPESGRFVECEDAIGCSVKAGEWSEEAGYHVLTVKRLPGASTAGSSYPNCCNPPHTVPLDEHPDTIALRWCRAELKEARTSYAKAADERRAARAERDTALAANGLEVTQHCQCRIDLRSALARIAELESGLAACGLGIARAVAELEHDDYPRHAAIRALEALR